MLHRFEVSESKQRIFQSHAAALTETRAGKGVALCPQHALASELDDGRLVRVQSPKTMTDGTWSTFSMRSDTPNQLVHELLRFVSTPRAIQAMLTGSGTNITRFKPRVHVTLWS